MSKFLTTLITAGNSLKPSSAMMIASADEVSFQMLGQHGPTTTFQFLKAPGISWQLHARILAVRFKYPSK